MRDGRDFVPVRNIFLDPVVHIFISLSHADFSYIILPSISVFEIRTNTKGYKSFFFRKVLVCLQNPIWTIICPYVTSVVQTFLSKMYHF